MKKTGIFLMVGIVLCLGTSHSEATVFNDGGVHEINWTISDNVDIYASSTGEPTIVNVVSGGRIDRFVFMYDNCELLVSGGTIGRYVFARGNNRIAISGGTIGRYIYAKNDSQIDISGGTVGGYINAKNSQIDISGGTIWGYVLAGSDSHLSITGGRINSYVACVGRSQGNISGGTFGRNLQVWNDAVMSIFGYNFNFDYGEITGGSSNILTGTLASGEEINNEFSIWDDASIILVPAPGSLVGLEIVGPNEVPENFSASYKAIAHYKDDSTRDVTDSVLWVVEPDTYASIDDYGVLTTKDIVQGQLVTIRASYTEGGVTVEGQKAIHIFALVGLEITGPNEVAGNFSASYKAIAHYDNNSTRDVTDSALWAVEPNTAANIDENGVLRTKDIVRDQSVTILASYTEGDVTFDAEKAIDILAICPMGTALQFDGVDDYVDCGNDSSLDITDNITISLWFYSKSWARPRGYYNGLISKRDDFYLGFDWEIYYAGNHREIRLYDGSVVTFDNLNVNPSLNTWHHLVITKNGTIATFYLDGILKGTDTTSLSWDRGASVRIGVIGLDRLDCAFNGLIDEVRIYNRALSAEEIWANMHSRLAGDEAGLVGYWDFDEGGGQVVYDLSGNGNDGQLGSTPNVDNSDPAWVDSDAPVGICSLYQIATLATERALERKLAMLEELLAALAEEWAAYEALEEWLESGDYGDLNKGDIVTAKQKIHSATQHGEQSIDALGKSIEKLKDALSVLGYEPEPPPPPPGQASNPNPADRATGVSPYADLSWTAGSDAVSHDVYFGATSPGTFRGNQTATTFDPGTMAEGTTYYWRIDEVNAGGTTTGTVWIFTTGGIR